MNTIYYIEEDLIKQMNAWERERNNRLKVPLIILALMFVLFGIVLLLLYLLVGKTTYTTSSREATGSQYLYCSTKSKSISGAFFDLSDAQSAEQAIKAIFNNKIDSVAYNATIDYGDQDTAKKKEAELNVTYGLYMQDNGRDMNDFSPNFSTVDDDVRISLFAKPSQLNYPLAKIFLIDLSNDMTLDEYNLEALSNLYSNKGLNCEIKE